MVTIIDSELISYENIGKDMIELVAQLIPCLRKVESKKLFNNEDCTF